ncbi:hypothetical protein IFM89_017821 [Coptis chinensis]|uniref:Uncharacterized protein n=1 Tax=Coptis chinensis TaxID=261450 RepID=A0A835LMM7_9MAGN|nr:hypothetical protein IFM89_017821 [Coptis chinensis]
MLLCSGDNKFRFHIRKLQSLEKYRGFCSSVSISCTSLLCFSSWESSGENENENGLLEKKKVRSQIDRSRESKKTYTNKTGMRKRFSLRLRPRLRLLSMRMRRASVRGVLEEFKIFLGKNLRKVTISSLISVVLGLCYLFLKFTSVPLPKAVAYSELIMNLQTGVVSNVLFEEGSRRILFNTVPESLDNNSQLLEEKPLDENTVSESVGDTSVGADEMKTPTILGVNVFRRFTKKQVSAPEWKYSTRKIDHDENFLLTLMREKGTAYSSAPQSALMSMRNVLITILSLWIPLTPLMWLLYRQLNAANSPAKKRRPTNQIVSFDDVEGVDTAKAELMEVGVSNFEELIMDTTKDLGANKALRLETDFY